MKINLLIIISAIALISGCTSTSPYVSTAAPQTMGMPGIYHRVERGQTLWRISRVYNIELDDLAKANNINDATKIEIGQMIFIPEREKPQRDSSKACYDDFIWPLKGRIVGTFGSMVSNMINKGLNIEPRGNTGIVASRSGKVIFYSDDFENFGKTLIIDHGDGFFTVYSRNAEVFVKIGEKVHKGTVIARAGSAGRNKNVYLHFEIRKGHLPQNPYFYLP